MAECGAPNWGNFQSVIQLGAALNFAYASLEAISQQPLILLSRKHSRALATIRKFILSRKIPDISPGKFQHVARQAEVLVFSSSFLKSINPYLSTLSGAVAITVLVYSSTVPNLPISPSKVVFICLVSYAWFAASLSMELGMRLWIERLRARYPDFSATS